MKQKSPGVPTWAGLNTDRTKMSGAKGSDVACGHALAIEAFGEEDAKRENSGLTAFAYLWRRFGPSEWGYDSHKDLCCYYLATPMKGVVLGVYPSASSVAYAFGYLVTDAVQKKCWEPMCKWEEKFSLWFHKKEGIPVRRNGKYTEAEQKAYNDARYGENNRLREAQKAIGKFPPFAPTMTVGGWKKGTPIIRQINQALLASMKELLRPVRVRDVAINLFGRCGYAEHEAEPSPLAGYGVPIAQMQKLAKADQKKRA